MVSTSAVIDIFDQWIDNQTRDDLKDLKDSIITNIVDEMFKWKNGWTSKIKQKLIKRYLIDNGHILERVENSFLESIFINKNIKEIKEKLNKAQSTTELNNLKDEIINDLHNTTANANTASTDTTNETVNSAATAAETPEADYEINHFDITVSPEIQNVYNQLKGKEKPDLAPFACAYKWYQQLKSDLKNPKYLTVVDFTKSKKKHRWYFINMENMTIEYATKVGQWSWSGTWEYATNFSNTNGTHASSLGFYRTPDKIVPNSKWTWRGLVMQGIESSNDNAAGRWICMHPWWETSRWCFTLPNDQAMEIIEKVKWDSLLYAHAKSSTYFAQSQFFNPDSNGNILV